MCRSGDEIRRHTRHTRTRVLVFGYRDTGTGTGVVAHAHGAGSVQLRMRTIRWEYYNSNMTLLKTSDLNKIFQLM